jgi:gas vesicle protein
MSRHEYDDEPYVVIERTSGSFGSFLVGIALGAGVALLLAPDSGLETRQRLGRSARKVKRAAREKAEELADNVTDRYEHARRSVEDKLEAARSAIDLKRRQAGRAIEAGREAAHQAREDLERRIAESKAAYQAGADVARESRGRRPRVEAAVDTDLDEDLDEAEG